MRVVIPGGSGHLGALLARDLHEGGDEVVVLSRTPSPAPWKVTGWNAEEIDGADVVINLAGRSVMCRYDAKHKREILESRVESTRWVGGAIAQAKQPPRVWLQASTATIYAHRFDAANDEANGIIGGAEPDARPEWHFSIDVARAWEREVDEAATPLTRKVKMRSAIVMSTQHGSAFALLRRVARFRLGGPVGSGRQYVSWVHYRDFIRAVRWLIEREDLSGAVNIAAPEALPNDDFMSELRRACGIRIGIPAPERLLDMAAFVLRHEPELLLKSRRVAPGCLLADGFRFNYPSWREAALDLCHGNGREW